MTSQVWRLAVRVTPKGGRDAVMGWLRDAAGRPVLAVRVGAAPEDGAANTALVALMARTLGIRRRDVAIASGTAARHKVLAIAGDPAALAARLAAAIGDPP